MQIIDQKMFGAVILDLIKETFVIHVASLSLDSKMSISLTQKAQIVLLVVKKVIIPAKPLDFADIFLQESTAALSEHFAINKYSIDLEPGKQPLYSPIYSLGLVEFETLKTNIKIHLANSFIQPSKSLAEVPILFDQ